MGLGAMGTNQNKRPHWQNLYIQQNYNSVDNNYEPHNLLAFISKYYEAYSQSKYRFAVKKNIE
jgi:hypothetical protein